MLLLMPLKTGLLNHNHGWGVHRNHHLKICWPRQQHRAWCHLLGKASGAQGNYQTEGRWIQGQFLFETEWVLQDSSNFLKTYEEQNHVNNIQWCTYF